MQTKRMSEHLYSITHPGEELFSKRPPLPEKLTIELNNSCNAKCVFCPFHSPYLKTRATNSSLKLSDVFAILEKAYSLGIGRKELSFFATGEFFLYKDFEECVRFAKSIGFEYVYITTNGILANKNNISRLISVGIDSIRFSINAADREQYIELMGVDAFDLVMENIRNTARMVSENSNNKKVNLSASVVIVKQNEGDKVRILEMLTPYIKDIVFFEASCLSTISYECKNKYEVPDKASPAPDRICGYIFNTLYINSRGNIALCCSSAKTCAHEYGSVLSDYNLEKAWYSPELIEFREKMLNHMISSECIDCPMRCI